MKACFFPSTGRSPILRAFSLLELLVVISIITILAGLVYPVITKVMIHAKEKKALNSALHLRNAIDAYFTEYRKFPLHDADLKRSDAELLSDSDLMNVLCASESESGRDGLNPKRIVFYTGSTARPMGGGRYQGGVRIDADGNAALYDAWGENYRVHLDTDSNGRIRKPSWDSRDNGAEIMNSILVWTPGADGEDSTEGDNIMTW